MAEKMTSHDRVMDDRKQLFDVIASKLEEGQLPPWRNGMTIASDCYNPVSNTRYKGINRLRLSVASYINEYDDPRWMTFNQAKQQGYKIKAGSKGTPVEYWKLAYKHNGNIISDKAAEALIKEGRKDELEMGYARAMRTVVFNGSQIEGIPPITVEPIQEPEKIRDIEHIMLNSEAPIYFDVVGRNYYSPSADEIHLTPRNMWENKDQLYSTALHEIAHSTGHDTRLGRGLQGKGFSKEAYAVEELRAELAAVMLSEKYNLTFSQEALDNSISYISSWKQAITNDEKVLWQSYKDAEMIVNYIETNMLQKELTPEKQQALEDILANGITPEVATKALEDALPPSKAAEADPYDGEDVPVAEYKPTSVDTDAPTQQVVDGSKPFEDLAVNIEFAEMVSTEKGSYIIGPDQHKYMPKVTYTGEDAYNLMRDLARADVYRHAQDKGGYDKVYLSIDYKGTNIHNGRMDMGDGRAVDRMDKEAYTMESFADAAVTPEGKAALSELVKEEQRYIAEGNPVVAPFMTREELSKVSNEIVIISQDDTTALRAKRADLVSIAATKEQDVVAMNDTKLMEVYRLDPMYTPESLEYLKSEYKTFDRTPPSPMEAIMERQVPEVPRKEVTGPIRGSFKTNDNTPTKAKKAKAGEELGITNPLSGATFYGPAATTLSTVMKERGYEEAKFVTEKQAANAGYEITDKTKGITLSRMSNGKEWKYTVYNVADVKGYPVQTGAKEVALQQEQGIPLSDVKQMYHKALPDQPKEHQYTEIHMDKTKTLFAMPTMHAEAASTPKESTYLGTYASKADIDFETFNKAVQTAYKDQAAGRSLEDVKAHLRDITGIREKEFSLYEPKTLQVTTPDDLKSYMKIEMKAPELQNTVNTFVAKKKVTVEQAYQALRAHREPKKVVEHLKVQAHKNAKEAARSRR